MSLRNPFTRRDLLKAAVVAPLLPSLSSRRLLAEEARQQPKYLSLQTFIEPGNDEFAGEKVARQQELALNASLKSGKLPLAHDAEAQSPLAASYRNLSSDLSEAVFAASDTNAGDGWQRWIASLGSIRRFQFHVLPNNIVRFEVASSNENKLLHRTGTWRVQWNGDGLIQTFAPLEEYVASAEHFWFRDVSEAALGRTTAFKEQLLRGVPYWRARLDPASGIDIYGSNGIAVGDIDGDGFDELYVCQPGGLPNRLFKFNAEGSAVDLTEKWGVGLLDDTSCALFLDLRNSGKQDLVVLRSGGPVLFLNEGGHYRLRSDAFEFETVPKGGFTGMAAADFDRDGKLDIYLCCYVYFQSEAQYTYASPYHDAQNGPPNFLFRNRLNADGSGSFIDCTQETGMNQNNNRFSFAPAWCDYNGDGWPDLYVANDFGRKNLYRNQNGRFSDVAQAAGVEDIGPGMSAAWFDYNHDGRPDLYVANMWTDAGQRVIADSHFKPAAAAPEAYRAHTMGNSLFRNSGEGTFQDVSKQEHVAFGRWAWSSGGHDFDNDGNPEIGITCGMLTNSSEKDLKSFFWRQVVARSPVSAAPSTAYENGWNAINQFVREDYSWNGHEPNVMSVRRGERYFDFSGVSGFDFADDSRAFAVFDFDGDGCPDIALKSRLGPQLRLLQNDCAGKNSAIAFTLQGTKSNRDAIGARVEVDGQTKWLEAGSGFLSQHSKRIIFGLGSASAAKTVRVIWPSGAQQEFTGLAAGHTHLLVEESKHVSSAGFRERKPLRASVCTGDNTLALHDTWLLEPVPLPSAHAGPGLFVISKITPEYEIFRRYLFDWRTQLKVPLALLLDTSGDVVKVYATAPTPSQVQADLRRLQTETPVQRAQMFPGFYVQQPARDFFKFGAAYLWAGYLNEALPYLQRVLHHSPDNARVLVLVGQLKLEAGQPAEAATYFQHAAKADPASTNAWIGLGDIAAKTDDPAAADHYRKALGSNPASAEAANGLGLALAKQGNGAEARKLFEKAIELRPDYAEAINNLAVLYSQEGETGEAIAAWSYGIKVAPEEAILYLNLGRTYVRLGQNDKARVVMQELLEHKPGDATARHALEELNGR